MLGHDSADGDYFETGTFTTDGNDDLFPTADDIKTAILESEAEIDRFTNMSWRPIRVINEWHNIKTVWRFTVGSPVKLQHRYVLPFDKTKGDSIKVYLYGSTGYKEFLDYDDGDTRGGSWWVNYEEGILYLHSKRPINWDKAIRVTYRYQYNARPDYDENGQVTSSSVTYVPLDIQRACRYLTAAHLIIQNDTTQFVIDGTDRVSLQKKAELWEDKAYQILNKRRELIFYID